MKNKKLIYILVPLVVIVWGSIIYKLITRGNGDDTLAEGLNLTQTKPEIKAVLDTFSIFADYRDPFLGKVHITPSPVSNQPPKPVVKQPPKPEKQVKWPSIVYGGVIKNQQSTKAIALLKVNGKDNLMSKGDITLDIELKNIWKDSVEVAYLGEMKIVRK